MLTKEGEDNLQRLSIYQDSEDQELQDKNIKNEKINNIMCLIVGWSGSGKSVCCETMTWEYYEHGYKVIYVSNKNGSEFDSAFCAFPPTADYHVDLMEAMSIKPLSEEKRRNLLHILHPITFGAPYHKLLPEIQWYGFRVNNLDLESICALVQDNADNQAVKSAHQIFSRLKKGESVWDGVWKTNEEIKKDKNKVSYDPDDMFVPSKSSGDSRTVSKVLDSFKCFRNNMFVLPENHPNVINMVEVLNDRERISVLCTKWGLSKREKYFNLIQFLVEISNALKTGKVKHPLCIVMEEVKVLLPKSAGDKTSYEKILNKLVRELLSTIRTSGKGTTMIATTQSRFGIDQGFANDFTNNIYGTLNQGDVIHLCKDLLIGKTMQEGLQEMGRGQFCWWEKCVKEGMVTSFDIAVPPFAHAEEGDDFLKLYHKYYPDKEVRYHDFFKGLLDERKVIETRMAEKLADYEAKQSEKEDKKTKKKKEKKEVSEDKVSNDDVLDAEIQVLNNSKKLDRGKKAYDLKKSGMSYRSICKEVGVKSAHTVKKLVVDYATSVGDKEFLVSLKLK